MPMPMHNDQVYPDHEDAVATVQAALDAGITFIDTADVYAPTWDTMGQHERIVGETVRTYNGSTADVVIATKGGIVRGEGETRRRDGSLDYLRSAVEKSLTALGVDQIDLYQWHRPDRWKVYGEVIENFKTLQDDGLVTAIGISNANIEEIEVAVQVLGEGGLASVQNEFSPRFRCSTDELDFCAEHRTPSLPWSPLGGTGGGATGIGREFAAFAEIGETHGVSPQQVVLAWEL